MKGENVDRVARSLIDRSLTLSVAESLTGGLLANRFAAGPDAGKWFSGGVVTYTREAKQRLLDAGDGPLVSERTAVEMARNVAHLFGSGASVAVTGAGGPDGHDGAHPGAVWIAVRIGEYQRTKRCDLEGNPEAICNMTCSIAVNLLQSALSELGTP